MAAKMIAIITISLIVAGLSGFGMAELIPNDTNSDENVNPEENVVSEFSQEKNLVMPSSSTQINP